jgi:hypothetical protein
VLDGAAKAAYRRRLGELGDSLEEARDWNDPERAARIEAEIDAVTGELARAAGLGGRDRRLPSQAEARARQRHEGDPDGDPDDRAPGPRAGSAPGRVGPHTAGCAPTPLRASRRHAGSSDGTSVPRGVTPSRRDEQRRKDRHRMSIQDTTIRRELGAGFEGDLVEPDATDYDEARAVYNGMIDRRPAAIARCASRHDVARVIAFAREHDRAARDPRRRPQRPGFGVIDDGIVADLSPMNDVAVDPAARTVRVGGGARWGDVDGADGRARARAPQRVHRHTGVGG